MDTENPGAREWDVEGIKARFLPEETGIYHDLDMLQDTAIEDINSVLENLVSLPVEVQELLDVLNHHNSSAATVGKICRKSAAISAMVLKLVNSPAFGLKKQVDDLPTAITYIGFNELKTIILSMQTFQRTVRDMDIIDIKGLLDHSIAAANLTEWVASQTHVPLRQGICCTGAVLRAIGKVFMVSWRPERFKEALEHSHAEKIPLIQAETKLIGKTHALAGSFMAERWNLSQNVQYIVKGCNRPEIDPEVPEMAVVYLAGQIASQEFGYNDGGYTVDEIDGEIGEFLKINYSTITEMCDVEGFDKFAESFIPKPRLRKEPPN